MEKMLCKKCCPICGKGAAGSCDKCCATKNSCTENCKKCCGICTMHKPQGEMNGSKSRCGCCKK